MRPHSRAPLFRVATALALFAAAPWAGCDSAADDDDSLSRVAGPTSEWPSRMPRDDKDEAIGRDPSSKPTKPSTGKPTYPSTGAGDQGEDMQGEPSKNPVTDSNTTPPPKETPPSEPPSAEPATPTTPGPNGGSMGPVAISDAGFATPPRDAGAPPLPSSDAGVSAEADAGDPDGGTADAGLDDGQGEDGRDSARPWWLPR